MCKLHVSSTSLQLRVRRLCFPSQSRIQSSCIARTSSKQSHYEVLAHKGLAEINIGPSPVLHAVSENVIPSSRPLETEPLVVPPIGFCCHPPLSLAMQDGALAKVHSFACIRLRDKNRFLRNIDLRGLVQHVRFGLHLYLWLLRFWISLLHSHLRR